MVGLSRGLLNTTQFVKTAPQGNIRPRKGDQIYRRVCTVILDTFRGWRGPQVAQLAAMVLILR